jgi:DNA modification methylase
MVFIGDSRRMEAVDDGSIDLVVTSPPYWRIKDYGETGQIGFGQDLHTYLKDLFLVWKECIRVLKPGRRVCINIGDQFARSSVYGRYKVIPLHSEIISQLETIGADYMGSIIWNKKTTMNTTGGAVVMGSYPYPPNGIVEIDYEFILIFRKPGVPGKVEKEVKESSILTKEEWKLYHSGHWNFGGARQISHEAMFPVELPKRLIRMFTFEGETVLDPFLGSGTTTMAAQETGRNSVGYELNDEFLNIMNKRFKNDMKVDIGYSGRSPKLVPDESYTPSVMNAMPIDDKKKTRDLHKVKDITSDSRLELSGGRIVTLGGIEIRDHPGASGYLNEFVKGKSVSIEKMELPEGNLVFLKNRIFVNGELVKMGVADVLEGDFKARKRLVGILRRSRSAP